MADRENREPTKLNALGLLNDFVDALDEKPFSFIGTRLEKVKGTAEKLRDLFQKATDEKKDKDKPDRRAGKKSRASLADFLPWHDVHEKGRDLWQQLLSVAIQSIDPRAKGHSQLLKYLDAATEFEDLLYGLAPFYRDHTLHSLWVYLIGVKLMGQKDGLGPIADELNWYVFNDVEKGEYPVELERWAGLEKSFLNDVIQKKRDAIWCIMALCHDLGYSLAKLPDLNKKVQAVLKFYDVPDFRHVGYALDLEHQYLVKQFLELMAMDVRITPGNEEDLLACIGAVEKESREGLTKKLLACMEDAKEKSAEELAKGRDLDLRKLKKGHRLDLRKLLMRAVKDRTQEGAGREYLKGLAGKAYDNVLTKCFRDDSSYWRLCKALERKEHGILSAYLLYKTMGIFADTSVRSPAEEWGLDDDEAVDNIIRGDILFAIAQHEFAFAHINQMSSLAEILILCDELEEFSRLGRQLQSRKYHETTAKTEVEIGLQRAKGRRLSPSNTKVDIAMTYNYSSDQKLPEFAKFCCRKAKRVCTLFSLGSERGKDETYVINKIKTTFNYIEERKGKDRTWRITFIMQKNHGVVTIQLRKRKPDRLKCRDDDIFLAGKPDMSLQKWLMDEKQLNIKSEDWPEKE